MNVLKGVAAVMIPSDFYDQKEVKTITQKLDSIEVDEVIKSYIVEWLQTEGMQNILLERPNLLRNNAKGNLKTRVINRFIAIVGKHILTQEHFTWENYCEIMQDIPKASKMSRALRLMARQFYLHTLPSRMVTNAEVKGFIKKYSHLLLPYEYAPKNAGTRKSTPFIEGNIITNFPLDSKVEQIVQLKCYSENGPANFFVFTQNEFLYNTVVHFLETIDNKTLNQIQNRIFITLFEDSLNGLQINSFADFNEDTFKTQLLYYNAFFHEFYPKGKEKSLGKRLLVKFYRYIDDLYLEKYGHRVFNSFSFNRNIITYKNYQRSIEEGYEIVNLNSIGDCPKSDKWFIVADIEKKGTHISNALNNLTNFELVRNTELREELKDYIWKLKTSYGRIYSTFSVLVDFLNEADAYYQRELEVSQLPNKSGTQVPNPLLGSSDIKLFSNRFLTFYYGSLIDNEEWAENTINLYISLIRLFLGQIQHKYNIPSMMVEFFSSIEVEYKGGTPISAEDFQEIYKEFEKRIQTNDDNLLKIVFQLTAETKLRLGETLGLDRNCIYSIDDSGKFGTIQYLSKISGGDYRYEVLMMEHIRLIQKAINITQKIYGNSDSALRKYIFICIDPVYDDKIVRIRSRFKRLYMKIIDDLFFAQKIKVRYTPNNLRDTFIEKAWQNVEDGLISTLEVGVITGNTAGVAYKHYRDRKNTQRYIEALYEVDILDDDFSKQIVDQETVEKLLPVQEGAGGCSSESCIKVEVDEDSFYKCLTCSKFLTTLERCSHFEQKMEEYKNKKERANSDVENNFYTSLMELYGAYLAEMYSRIEVDK